MKTYLLFTLGPPKPKTKTWLVSSRLNGNSVGVVEWHGPWRRYVFAPDQDTIFEETCLRQIADFCEKQSDEHRADLSCRESEPKGGKVKP